MELNKAPLLTDMANKLYFNSRLRVAEVLMAAEAAGVSGQHHVDI